MNIDIFYKEVLDLLPYKQNRELDFRRRLRDALNRYEYLAINNIGDQDTIADISYICNKINEIVDNSMKGLQSRAFMQLQFLIQGKKGVKAKLDLNQTLLSLPHGSNFYRIRKMEYVFEIDAKELFHIPITSRGKVKTQRYSTPGYPCLYIGKSIYGCWEEMRRPSIQLCAVSRFQNTEEMKLVDLCIPEKEKMVRPEFQKLLPLIISCMIPVANDDDTFKPEYIIPQLLIEWILKKRKNMDIDGVAYTSTHRNKEFEYPMKTFINYAIPVFSVDSRHVYCKKMCNMFQLTQPTTIEIERLKGFNVDAGEYGDNVNIKDENYRTSDFGQLEEHLINEVNFPLQKVASK